MLVLQDEIISEIISLRCYDGLYRMLKLLLRMHLRTRKPFGILPTLRPDGHRFHRNSCKYELSWYRVRFFFLFALLRLLLSNLN